MDILLFDMDKYSPSDLKPIVDKWHEQTGNFLMVLPKDMGLIRDISLEQLITIRDFINEIIENNTPVEENKEE